MPVVKKSFAERQAARVEKAALPGAVVLALQSFDTRLIVNMINQLDRQFRVSRDRLFQPGFEVEKIEPFFKRWQEFEEEINKFAKSLSEITGIRYRDPLDRGKEEKKAETSNKADKA
jgi:hypothetical protein